MNLTYTYFCFRRLLLYSSSYSYLCRWNAVKNKIIIRKTILRTTFTLSSIRTRKTKIYKSDDDEYVYVYEIIRASKLYFVKVFKWFIFFLVFEGYIYTNELVYDSTWLVSSIKKNESVQGLKCYWFTLQCVII
jgi:hypothetical protein